MPSITSLEHLRTEYRVKVVWERPQGIKGELVKVEDFVDWDEAKGFIEQWVEHKRKGLNVRKIVVSQREAFVSPWVEGPNRIGE